MGLLANRLNIRAESLEDPSKPLVPDKQLLEMFGIHAGDAGVAVSVKSAMGLSTAFSCIHGISSDMSSVPFSIFERMPDGSAREAIEHPLYALIHSVPNPNMTTMSFHFALMANKLGWGNGYSYIRRDKGGIPRELVPLPASKTSPVMVLGVLKFATTATKDGNGVVIDAGDMLHVPGATLDGIVGVSPIQQCKNAFGLAMAAERFGSQFFGNGARTSGVLTNPGTLGDEAYDRLKKSIEDKISGANAQKPLLLEDGLKWEQVSVNPNDAQFLETRAFQVAQIAGLYRYPLHMLQIMERSSNNNIEHQALEYIMYTLRPSAVAIEQEFTRKLLRGNFYCEFDMNALQRGDFASQTAGWNLLRNMGAYSVNNILRQLRQNPISKEDGGDLRLAPLNMVNLALLAKETDLPSQRSVDSKPNTPPAAAQPAQRMRQDEVLLVSSFSRLFRDAIGRTMNRSTADDAFCHRAFQPIVAAMAEWMGSADAAKPLPPELEAAVTVQAKACGANRAAWTKDNAGDEATRLTQETYIALKAALSGETE